MSKKIWFKEECLKEALKYTSKLDFIKNSATAYSVACREEFLEEACAHMISNRKPKKYWTFERCKESATKYQHRSDFEKFDPSGYQTARVNNG